MARVIEIVTTICLLCALCVCVAAEPAISITALDQAIVGQIVPVEIWIPAKGYSKVKCTLSVDEQQVQIQSLPEAQGWDADFLGKTLTLNRKEDGPADVQMKLKLKILPVPAQTKIRMSFCVTGEDGVAFGEVTCEITVVEPLSHENFLTALSVENGALSPQFHPDILQYSTTVPADCQQPRVYAVGAQKTGVEVSQTEFNEEGICTVTVTVTAENGSGRNYTIQVIRDKPVETPPETTAATRPETRPTESTKPTQLTQPTQPTETTQPETWPTESTKPTQPIQPTQPTETTQPIQPTQLTQPTKPTQPTQQTQPTKPNQTTQPPHTTQSIEPTQQPSGDVSVGLREEEVPGWLVVAAVLAGAALGGAGGILLSQKKNKDR